MKRLKRMLKLIVPPIVNKAIGKILISPPVVEWIGPFESWEIVADQCTAYDTNEIFNRVLYASREVASGRAVYERDSYLFDHIEYSWPLLSALLWVRSKDGFLNVIDFGGSLGSTFRQNVRFLSNLSNIMWNVVEQKHFVEIGNHEFETESLKFEKSIADVLNPNAILFLSTLPYLEDPWKFIQDATDSTVQYLIIDRTAFHDGSSDSIYKQIVRPPIYHATYPCRVFAKQVFELNMNRLGWEVLESWVSELQPTLDGRNLGYIFIRKQTKLVP